jgi:hypothetical protein
MRTMRGSVSPSPSFECVHITEPSTVASFPAIRVVHAEAHATRAQTRTRRNIRSLKVHFRGKNNGNQQKMSFTDMAPPLPLPLRGGHMNMKKGSSQCKRQPLPTANRPTPGSLLDPRAGHRNPQSTVHSAQCRACAFRVTGDRGVPGLELGLDT